MSQLTAVRVRSQRSAAAAVERARLTVVANRPSSARRAPFAVLVFLILGAGVVGLLMFNTQMQQASIHATELQAKADRLQAASEELNREVGGLRDPQEVAKAAVGLGMVMPQNPAFVDLKDGRVHGVPIPATSGDGTKVRPPVPPLPPSMKRNPIIQFAAAPPASTTTGTPAGSNETQDKPAQGDPR